MMLQYKDVLWNEAVLIPEQRRDLFQNENQKCMLLALFRMIENLNPLGMAELVLI